MPENTSAVIMIENINVPDEQQIDEQQVEIIAPAFPWQNVRRMGEDIVATELVFARNHKITPYCLGALISAGVFNVNVYKKPAVFIQPTGSELVDHHNITQKGLPPGQVLDSNSHMLGKLVNACGGGYFKNGIVEDTFELIAKPIADAAVGDYDIIFISGGSSAGSKDFTREVISKLGEVLIHGVTMMPGKPVIVGKINGKPIFGIPGYPVSAIIAFEQLVRPLINRMLHQSDIPDHEIQVIPTKKIPSKLGLEEFLRVKLGNVGGQIVATPLPRVPDASPALQKRTALSGSPIISRGLLKTNQPLPPCSGRCLKSIIRLWLWAAMTTPWMSWPTCSAQKAAEFPCLPVMWGAWAALWQLKKD